MGSADAEVSMLADLMALEARIESEVRKYPLDALLLGLRALQPTARRDHGDVPAHVIGTAARFATRFGTPGPTTANTVAISRKAIDPLLRLCGDFAHADPCGWEPPGHSLLSVMLRHVGNQFPYNINVSGKWGRADLLFHQIPGIIRGKNGVPEFDFASRFQDLTGVTVSDFIDVGYVAYCAARTGNHLGFTRGYFEKAREQRMLVADDDVIRRVLSRYAADSSAHAKLSDGMKQDERKYAAYDFNSLFVHPLIRPWPLGTGEEMDLDRMVAPIPDLILYRMTSGIYYDMRMRWKEAFDRFFGHMLNAYVGRLLSAFVPASDLISEADIRKDYPTSAGKVPDWIIVDRKTAILVEVKVARIHRIVYATGDEQKLDENLEAVRRALYQMSEFRHAVARRAVGLERLSRCKEFINIVVTLEQTYLANSDPFKARVRSLLDAPMQCLDWAVLGLDDLEWFQTHLSDGSIDIGSAFRLCLRSRSDEVINILAKQTGRTFRDSMLHQEELRLHKRLGVAV